MSGSHILFDEHVSVESKIGPDPRGGEQRSRRRSGQRKRMCMNPEMSERVARELRPFASLFEVFGRAGFQLYAVGGCVRDWALGRTPKDVDFTTDALPEDTKRILSEHGFPVIPVGEVFGTIATTLGKKTYEITTFRVKESYMRGSRHPVVCYGHDLSLDLERRDLTINAMAATAGGEIIDPFGGLEDLRARVLRVPRSSFERSVEIFSDDPLRVLRLARFRARLGFDVCPDATRAARSIAGSVLTVSHERLFSEFDGLLSAASPQEGIAWLWEVGVWPLLWPETLCLRGAHGVATSLSGGEVRESVRDLWAQTMDRVLCAVPQDDEKWCAMMSLLGYAATLEGEWAERVTALWAQNLVSRFKFSVARGESIVRRLTPLPAGEPTARAVREFAMTMGKELPRWDRFQEVRLETICASCRDSERQRLERWRDALKPYLADPARAEIRLPADLSKRIMDELHVHGKTLGLYLAHCREAVLDQKIDEREPSEVFVAWLASHRLEPQ